MRNKDDFNEASLLIAKENLRIALPYISECLSMYKKGEIDE